MFCTVRYLRKFYSKQEKNCHYLTCCLGGRRSCWLLLRRAIFCEISPRTGRITAVGSLVCAIFTAGRITAAVSLFSAILPLLGAKRPRAAAPSGAKFSWSTKMLRSDDVMLIIWGSIPVRKDWREGALLPYRCERGNVANIYLYITEGDLFIASVGVRQGSLQKFVYTKWTPGKHTRTSSHLAHVSTSE